MYKGKVSWKTKNIIDFTSTYFSNQKWHCSLALRQQTFGGQHLVSNRPISNLASISITIDALRAQAALSNPVWDSLVFSDKTLDPTKVVFVFHFCNSLGSRHLSSEELLQNSEFRYFWSLRNRWARQTSFRVLFFRDSLGGPTPQPAEGSAPERVTEKKDTCRARWIWTWTIREVPGTTNQVI